MPVRTVPMAFDEKEYEEAASLKKPGETWPKYHLRMVRMAKEMKETPGIPMEDMISDHYKYKEKK